MRDDFADKLQQIVWNHRKFSDALALVHAHATFSPPGSMILVAGASGVGKTTLREQLRKGLVGSADSWPEGAVPVASIAVLNDVAGLFNSKSFVLRFLAAVGHPFYDAQLGQYSTDNKMPRLDLERIRLGHSEPQLRIALEKAIHYRGVKYLLIDEAQHLLKTGSIRKAIDNLDSIKGLAEATGAIVILLGTFEILPIWNRSAQLNRRLQDVVLDRYKEQEPEDLIDFERLLENFSQQIPLAGSLSLRDLNEFIYRSTLGIIGEVARLVRGAHALMTALEKSSITRQMLIKSAHSPAKLQTLQRETFGGEAMLVGSATAVEHVEHFPRTMSKGRKGRRGKRLPIRDPVTNRTSIAHLPEDGDKE